MRRFVGILGGTLLTVSVGCTYSYTKIGHGEHDLGRYTITTPVEWNEWLARPTVWTVHGQGLEYLLHVNGVAEGQRIFLEMRENTSRRFMAKWRASEVVDAFMESLSMRGANSWRVVRLEPAPFGPWDGFGFVAEFESAFGIPMKGSGRGAIIDGELHLFFYAGAREHYFHKHLYAFEAIVASIST